MKKRIGIVGNGWWVDSMYVPALKDNDYSDVVAICGRDKEKTLGLARQWNIAGFHGNDSYKKLYGLVDAVIIASSTSSHYEIARYFLNRNIPILCEKPVGTSLSESQKLLEMACSEQAMVAYTYYYMPEWQYVLDNKETYQHATKFKMTWDAGFMFGVNEPGEKYNAKKGNHLFSDVASHFIFLANKLFPGKTVVKKTFIPYNTLDIQETEDFKASESGGLLTLVYDDGMVGEIEVQTDLRIFNEFKMEHRLELYYGDSLILDLNNDWDCICQVKTKDDTINFLKEDEDVKTLYHGTFRYGDTLSRQFVKNVYHGLPMEITLYDACKVHKILENIYQ